MREITDHKVNGLNEAIAIMSLDEPGPGGAHHKYDIAILGSTVAGVQTVTSIEFQNGPIKEAGVNGISNEALLAIVIDRLRCFDAGPFRSRENALALTNCQQAMQWLHQRTRDRMARGVEGTNQK